MMGSGKIVIRKFREVNTQNGLARLWAIALFRIFA